MSWHDKVSELSEPALIWIWVREIDHETLPRSSEHVLPKRLSPGETTNGPGVSDAPGPFFFAAQMNYGFRARCC
jgi:hypothetical protein